MLINLKHISGFGINQLQQFQNNLVRKRNQLSQNLLLCIKEFYLFIEFFFSYIRRIWTSCAESISYDIFRSRSFKINIVFQLHCVHVQKSIHKEITHFACTSAMEFGITKFRCPRWKLANFWQRWNQARHHVKLYDFFYWFFSTLRTNFLRYAMMMINKAKNKTRNVSCE